ncbi:MAG: hypothetical protein ACXVZL_10815, partial [Gaiellaceae bacterium]
MTGCSRSCASSLLALSTAGLLLAGCGATSPDRVEHAFAAQGIGLVRVPLPARMRRPWGLWPVRPARAIFVPARDDSVVITVVVYPGEGDAAQQAAYVRRRAPGSFEHFSRVGAVLVDWDAAAPADERAAL